MIKEEDTWIVLTGVGRLYRTTQVHPNSEESAIEKAQEIANKENKLTFVAHTTKIILPNVL